jgi:hypothetical protein
MSVFLGKLLLAQPFSLLVMSYEPVAVSLALLGCDPCNVVGGY